MKSPSRALAPERGPRTRREGWIVRPSPPGSLLDNVSAFSRRPLHSAVVADLVRQQDAALPTQLLALLNRPEMLPPSAAIATTATTAIRPTSSAYSTMEAPRSVRARSSRPLWKPRTAKNALRNSSVIRHSPLFAP